MIAAALELASVVGMKRAAKTFDRPRAALYRARAQRPLGPPAPRPAPPRALTDVIIDKEGTAPP